MKEAVYIVTAVDNEGYNESTIYAADFSYRFHAIPFMILICVNKSNLECLS